MRSEHYSKSSDVGNTLEDSDNLPKANSEEVASVFNALGIEDEAEEVLNGERADLRLEVKLDQRHSSDYAIRVQSNEPVEGEVELTVSTRGGEKTYDLEAKMRAQEIFSLDYMSSYDQEEPRGVTIEQEQGMAADGEYQEENVEAD